MHNELYNNVIVFYTFYCVPFVSLDLYITFMRNIKFRYVYKNRHWDIVDLRETIFSLGLIEQWGVDNYLSVCDSYWYELLAKNQSTGLKDQEGKEIFEGDVIVTTVLHQSVPKGTTMVIVWDDTELCFFAEYIQHLNQKWYRRLRVTSNKKFKIIGNIYENPELLNQ